MISINIQRFFLKVWSGLEVLHKRDRWVWKKPLWAEPRSSQHSPGHSRHVQVRRSLTSCVELLVLSSHGCEKELPLSIHWTRLSVGCSAESSQTRNFTLDAHVTPSSTTDSSAARSRRVRRQYPKGSISGFIFTFSGNSLLSVEQILFCLAIRKRHLGRLLDHMFPHALSRLNDGCASDQRR